MQCSCGGETRLTTHTVKTAKGIHSWLGQDNQHPVMVEQNICSSCGRLAVRLFDADTKSELRQVRL